MVNICLSSWRGWWHFINKTGPQWNRFHFEVCLFVVIVVVFFLIFIPNLTSHLQNHCCLLQAGKKHLTLYEFDSFLMYHVFQLLYIGKGGLLLFNFMSRQIQASMLTMLCYGNLGRVRWTASFHGDRWFMDVMHNTVLINNYHLKNI